MLAAALASALGACSTVDRATQGMAEVLTYYRPEVVQGNFVSKEQAAALQPGMTRLQVRDALGTPLVTSVFHGDRWDYVFTMRRKGVENQNYHLTVYFKDGVVDHFDGDEMPGETEFVRRIGAERSFKVPQLQATEEQLAKFPSGGGVDAPQSAASAPVRPHAGSYPPLEAEAAR